MLDTMVDGRHGPAQLSGSIKVSAEEPDVLLTLPCAPALRHEHDVQHFKVIKDNLGQYFLWAEKFTSFNQLVDFYKSTSISKQRLIYLKDGSEDIRAPNAHQVRAPNAHQVRAPGHAYCLLLHC